MKTLYQHSAYFFLILFALLAGCSTVPSAAGVQAPVLAPSLSSEQVPQHCTVFYAADDKVALGGDHADSFNPRTKIWFLPPEEGKYGVAVVGFEDYNPQGAVNDHGLFYGQLTVRFVEVPEEKGKPVYDGSLVLKAMTECATVDCVIQLYDRYSKAGTWNGQQLFGDSTGDSAIIEPLAVVRKEGQYQVATNFFQSEVKPEDRTDRRYTTAMGMFKQADHYSVDLFRDILNATHQKGPVHTLFSTIYDLKQNLIYLYYFHDFDHVVVLNLKDELAKGIHAYDIPSLFPPSADALAFGKSITDRVSARQEALVHAQVKPELLATYAGNYGVPPNNLAFFKTEGDRLYVRNPRLPWVELIPVSDTHFAQVLTDFNGNVIEAGFTFQVQAGQVTGVEYDDGAGHKTVLPKIGQAASAPKEQPSSLASNWVWLLAALVLIGLCVVGFVIWRLRMRRLTTTRAQ